VLSDGSCSAARRPNIMRSCDAGPCVTRWYVTDWEEVSSNFKLAQCVTFCQIDVEERHQFLGFSFAIYAH